MKMFITGATGYVGSHLVKVLIKQGHSVSALVRIDSSFAELKKLGATLCLGDITKKETIAQATKEEIDVVYHLAFSLLPVSNGKVNIDGTRNLIDVFRKKKIKRFIFTSSALVYGQTDPNQLITEDFLCRPNMKYSKHQLKMENLLLDAFRNDGMPAVIIRPSEIYGGKGGYFGEEYFKGVVAGKIPVIGKGDSNSSMSHIDDLIQALIQCVKMEDIEGQIFNINTPDVITINERANFITDKAGVKRAMHIPKIMAWIVASFAMMIAKIIRKQPFLNYEIVKVATMKGGVRDIQKAQKLLGFQPKYRTILEGIGESYFQNIKELKL